MEVSAAKCSSLWRCLRETSNECPKKTLKAILANRLVPKEVLRTALVEAEGILNGRPITHVSTDAGDIEALTPNHFLLLRANPSYEDSEVSDREIKTVAEVPSLG